MSSRLLWGVIGAGGLWFLFKMMKEAKQILPQQQNIRPDLPEDFVEMPMRPPGYQDSVEVPDLSQWVDEGSELAAKIWGYSGSPSAEHVHYKGSH